MMDPVYSIALVSVFGLAIGSFLNVVIHRLPRMLEREWRQQCAELRGETSRLEADYNLSVPRSACPACGHQIAWHENIPVLSWLALRGRCAGCREWIGVQYPLVELVTGVLFAGAAWLYGPAWLLVPRLLFVCAMIVLFMIDLQHRILPNVITLPGIAVGLAHLDELDGVGHLALDLAHGCNGALEALLFLRDRLRLLGIVPQLGVLDARVQLVETA